MLGWAINSHLHLQQGMSGGCRCSRYQSPGRAVGHQALRSKRQRWAGPHQGIEGGGMSWQGNVVGKGVLAQQDAQMCQGPCLSLPELVKETSCAGGWQQEAIQPKSAASRHKLGALMAPCPLPQHPAPHRLP